MKSIKLYILLPILLLVLTACKPRVQPPDQFASYDLRATPVKDIRLEPSDWILASVEAGTPFAVEMGERVNQVWVETEERQVLVQRMAQSIVRRILQKRC